MEQAVPRLDDGRILQLGPGMRGRHPDFRAAGHYDKFVDQLTKFSEGMTMGNPLDPKTKMGPLVSQGAVRHGQGLPRSRQEGRGRESRSAARPRTGKGYFVKPTVFADVNNNMRIAREEIFGPVAAAIPFKDENDAVIQGNDTDLRAGRRGLDQRHQPRAQGRACAQGRHGLGELLWRDRSDFALWRLQTVGLRPRTGQVRARALHANQDRLREAVRISGPREGRSQTGALLSRVHNARLTNG